MWWDFALRFVQEHYKREMLAYYYNRAEEWGKEVVVTYKWHDLPPGAGVVDLELGRFDTLTYHDWITDTTVDDGHGWGYLKETEYKSLSTLVHYLVDNVSKNGYMLLNVGPKPDGEIPQRGQGTAGRHRQMAGSQRRGHLRHDGLDDLRRGANPDGKGRLFHGGCGGQVHGGGHPLHREGR